MKIRILLIIGFASILAAGTVQAQTAPADTLRELMRRIEILTEEFEKQQFAQVREKTYESKFGLGPAASQVYQAELNEASLAGYGEILYENYASMLENDAAANTSDQLDYLRNIIYFGYRFSEKFLFNAEIEFEHGKTGGSNPGSVSMEFGYIDALLHPLLNLRAGMVLVPVGIINEYHEPGTYFGALRPEIESQIIPSTWRTIGAGLMGGTASGFDYRIFVLEGLNGAKFSSSGIRSARQNGAKAIAEDFAFAGRLEYKGQPGIVLGGSFYSGNSGQGITDDNGQPIHVRTTILSLHGMLARKGFELRALYARSFIDDAYELNFALGNSGAQSIGKEQGGYYFTAAYDILQHFAPGSDAKLQPYFQYEKLNTQQEVPVLFSSNPATDRSNITFGMMYRPHPNIGLKADFLQRSNEAETGLNQFNLALTYMF